jgi:hypothetical protein
MSYTQMYLVLGWPVESSKHVEPINTYTLSCVSWHLHKYTFLEHRIKTKYLRYPRENVLTCTNATGNLLMKTLSKTQSTYEKPINHIKMSEVYTILNNKNNSKFNSVGY